MRPPASCGPGPGGSAGVAGFGTGRSCPRLGAFGSGTAGADSGGRSSSGGSEASGGSGSVVLVSVELYESRLKIELASEVTEPESDVEFRS